MALLKQRTSDLPACHPAALIFPLMEDAELDALAESIRVNGQLHPVMMYGGRILDGRNRWLACGIAGVEPKIANYTGNTPTQYAFEANATRRHLTTTQRAAAATELVPLLEEEAKARVLQAASRGGKAERGKAGVESSPPLRDESARSTAKAAKMNPNRADLDEDDDDEDLK